MASVADSAGTSALPFSMHIKGHDDKQLKNKSATPGCWDGKPPCARLPRIKIVHRNSPSRNIVKIPLPRPPPLGKKKFTRIVLTNKSTASHSPEQKEAVDKPNSGSTPDVAPAATKDSDSPNSHLGVGQRLHPRRAKKPSATVRANASLAEELAAIKAKQHVERRRRISASNRVAAKTAKKDKNAKKADNDKTHKTTFDVSGNDSDTEVHIAAMALMIPSSYYGFSNSLSPSPSSSDSQEITGEGAARVLMSFNKHVNSTMALLDAAEALLSFKGPNIPAMGSLETAEVLLSLSASH